LKVILVVPVLLVSVLLVPVLLVPVVLVLVQLVLLVLPWQLLLSIKYKIDNIQVNIQDAGTLQ
jgi:hypothetical protein